MSSLITGFHHVCIKTRDWDRTLAFYVTALGFTEKITWRTAPNRAAMFDTGHLDHVAERVRATGAQITTEPKDVTIATTNAHAPVPIRIFFCEGPNGEIIEFFQNTLT